MRNTILYLCVLLNLIACNDSSNYTLLSKTEQISMEQAQVYALDFVNNVTSNTRSGKNFTVENVKAIKTSYITTRSEESDTLFYVVNFTDENGFVITSTHNCKFPVIAYIEDGNYLDNDTLIPIVRDLLYSYLDTTECRMDRFRTDDDWNPGTPYFPENWQVLSPILKTRWNQNGFYNNYCPNGSLAGCVPVAVSQICTYIEKPDTITWSYNDSTLQSAMDWSTINLECESINGSPYSANTRKQVEGLIKFWGETFNADYNNDGGVESDVVVSALRQHGINAGDLTEYNIYSPVFAIRDENAIVFMMGYSIKEITGNHVEYSGGHAWVADGFVIHTLYPSTSFYIHCNWGWGGYCNGYYASDLFDTETGPVYGDNFTRSNPNFKYLLQYSIIRK